MKDMLTTTDSVYRDIVFLNQVHNSPPPKKKVSLPRKMAGRTPILRAAAPRNGMETPCRSVWKNFHANKNVQ
jgi:hypothetical protein